MGFRFFKRIRLLPGVNLNISKSGPSVSLGPRGAKMTFGRKGARATIGLPGTGMSYTTTQSYGSKGGGSSPAASGGKSTAAKWMFPLVAVIGIGTAVWSAIHPKTPAHSQKAHATATQTGDGAVTADGSPSAPRAAGHEGKVFVPGYYRKDGTYVHEHYRER